MDLRRIVRNVSSQWLTLIAQLVVSVAMTPFLVSRLGQMQYGIVVLASGLVGYSGILYLGLGAAIVKYVAEHHARGEQDRLNETVSTIFTVYLAIGIVCLVLCALVAGPLLFVLRIPPEHTTAARILLSLMGVAIFFQFPGSVYAGVLMGLERFDVLNVRGLILLLVRTVITVVLVLRWPTMLVVGAITLVGAALEQFIAYQFVHRVMPALRVSVRLYRRDRLRTLFTFSGQSFLFTLSEKLINYTDEFVITAFLGPAAVTPYALSLRLVDYAREGVDRATIVVMPGVSAAAARGEIDRLKATWRTGSKAVFVLAMPIVLVFIAWGHHLLGLWLRGEPAVAARAYGPLVPLALAFLVQVAGRGLARPLFEGLGELTIPARITIIEGVVNLSLSILLVRLLDVEGVAIATLVPAALTGVLVMPWYVCRRLGISFVGHLANTYLRSLPPLLPAWGALLLAERFGMHRHLLTAAIACAAVLVVYVVAALFLMFDRDERAHVLEPLARRLGRPATG